MDPRGEGSESRQAAAAGPSRRQLLTRGGVLVVAAAYATPVVSVLSMTAAHAQEASGAPTSVLDRVVDKRPPAPGDSQPGRSDTATTTTTREAQPSALPFTGGDQQAPVLLASALVAAGAAMTAAAHKRTAQVLGSAAPR